MTSSSPRLLPLTLLLSAGTAWGGLPEAIARVKPSIVAVGTLQPTRRPPAQYLGTGFVVGDGRHVLTNLHVIPEIRDSQHRETLTIFVPQAGGGAAARAAAGVARAAQPDPPLPVFPRHK